MIPVKLQPEPPDFYVKVQQPGEAFLVKTCNPKGDEWNRHSYWRRVIENLHKAYSGICAYSCHWIPYDTGAKTVEHFKPKKKYPEHAYHWDNYRLVCSTLNGRKSDHEDILDPFELEPGWFVLDFPSLLVHPSAHLAPEDAERVKTTIKRLGLNDEGTCLQARLNWLQAYVSVPLPFSYLERNAPFIAQELKRQDLVTKIFEMMGYSNFQLS